MMTVDTKTNSMALDDLITTDALRGLAEDIVEEYHLAIDDIMVKTTQADIDELGEDLRNGTYGKNLDEIASNVTIFRMKKYSGTFFNHEMERLLDTYNSKDMDKVEFLIRCQLLTNITNTMSMREI